MIPIKDNYKVMRSSISNSFFILSLRKSTKTLIKLIEHYVTYLYKWKATVNENKKDKNKQRQYILDDPLINHFC